MFCFIDDIHQSNINDLNRQSAIEFLRQHLDSERFYDFATKKWQRVKNITYVSTVNYKSYIPSKSISNKTLKHFHIVAQHFPRLIFFKLKIHDFLIEINFLFKKFYFEATLKRMEFIRNCSIDI